MEQFGLVCGGDTGYFGLQELAIGKKLIIFSVWNSEQNDSKAVTSKHRTKVVFKDASVRIGRFGGEGTGGQSFPDYEWKLNQPYRLKVSSKVVENRTEYSGYLFVLESKQWRHLITFSTITNGKNLKEYHSFIEDFKRNRTST